MDTGSVLGLVAVVLTGFTPSPPSPCHTYIEPAPACRSLLKAPRERSIMAATSQTRSCCHYTLITGRCLFMFQRVAIIGMGLIGGSIGLALRKKRAVVEVTGYDPGRGCVTVLAG